MKLIDASYEIESEIDGDAILRRLEKFIRTAYRSEDKIDQDSHHRIIKLILNRNHESVLEAESITVRIRSNIGFTREMNRHRHLSLVETSTRYCNYSKDKFGNELTFITPPTFIKWSDNAKDIFLSKLQNDEIAYMNLLKNGCNPQEAREALPLATLSEACYVGNLREWRHIFKLRCSSAAHPSMLYLMPSLLKEFQEKIPFIFDNIEGVC